MYWRLERSLQLSRRIGEWVRDLRWARRAKSFPHGPSGPFLLHIGCGEVDSPGFVNVDARPYPHVHVVTRDLFNLRVIPNGVASLVYMCHVLEHVPRGKVPRVLEEMRRVLAPGGTLRIAVPDFDLILAMYEQTNHDIDAIAGPLMGGQDYQFNFHYSVFSLTNLTRLLTEAGFLDVCVWDPALSTHHDFDDWANKPVPYGQMSFPVSLNLEAVSPQYPRT